MSLVGEMLTQPVHVVMVLFRLHVLKDLSVEMLEWLECAVLKNQKARKTSNL